MVRKFWEKKRMEGGGIGGEEESMKEGKGERKKGKKEGGKKERRKWEKDERKVNEQSIKCDKNFVEISGIVSHSYLPTYRMWHLFIQPGTQEATPGSAI